MLSLPPWCYWTALLKFWKRKPGGCRCLFSKIISTCSYSELFLIINFHFPVSWWQSLLSLHLWTLLILSLLLFLPRFLSFLSKCITTASWGLITAQMDRWRFTAVMKRVLPRTLWLWGTVSGCMFWWVWISQFFRFLLCYRCLWKFLCGVLCFCSCAYDEVNSNLEIICLYDFILEVHFCPFYCK